MPEESISKAEGIFKAMKKIGLKYGYDNYLLFSMFDKERKGFIDSHDIY